MPHGEGTARHGHRYSGNGTGTGHRHGTVAGPAPARLRQAPGTARARHCRGEAGAAQNMQGGYMYCRTYSHNRKIKNRVFSINLFTVFIDNLSPLSYPNTK